MGRMFSSVSHFTTDYPRGSRLPTGGAFGSVDTISGGTLLTSVDSRIAYVDFRTNEAFNDIPANMLQS